MLSADIKGAQFHSGNAGGTVEGFIFEVVVYVSENPLYFLVDIWLAPEG